MSSILCLQQVHCMNGQKLALNGNYIFPSSYHSDVTLTCGALWPENKYLGLGASSYPEKFPFTSGYACGKLVRNAAVFIRDDY